MEYKDKNTNKRSISHFTITCPDTGDEVVLHTDNDVFIVTESGENTYQVTIPLSCINMLIDNLKRAASKAKLFQDLDD